MKKMFKYLILSIFLGISIGAYAADLYVPSQYKTIQKAVNKAKTGDKIYVAPGIYKESITIKKGISLIGINPDKYIITSSHLKNGNTIIFEGKSANGTITGFTITGAKGFLDRGNGILCCDGASPVIMKNRIKGNENGGIFSWHSSPNIIKNIISKNRCAVDFSDSDSIISNNMLLDNRFGITCSESSLTITNNTISRNSLNIGSDDSSYITITNNLISEGKNGIGGNKSYLTITNNTIVGNKRGGINVGNSQIIIMNNIIAKNGKNIAQNGKGERKTRCGIDCRNSDIKGDFNCFFDNGPGIRGTQNYCLAPPKPPQPPDEPEHYIYKSHLGANEIQKDPKFISETDFHLKPFSPCIDRGSNKAPKLPRKDKDGKERIINKRVDIGAYEYSK
ncbi:MAG: NosD domain-containing protein [bacterium]